MASACATCARTYESHSEKPLLPGRDLFCCGRSICLPCLSKNKRYQTYCPYCQITTEPSLLPQGLKDPPAYSTLHEQTHTPQQTSQNDQDEPPAYSIHPSTSTSKREDQPAPDVLHFLTPNDSMRSLSLAYGVPIDALRKTNNLYSDHLVQARRTLLIPGEYYKGGVSLSPRPVDGEEEEKRKMMVRRWMVGCKVADYDVALLYLKQAEWDLEEAVQAFKDDERWEKEHPMQAKQKGKGKMVKEVGMRRFVG